MKTKLIVLLGMAFGLTMIASPTFAHHAGSLYDTDHPITVTGVVTEYLFVNPHTQIKLEVTDEAGKVSTWTVESAAPQRMFRAGWTKTTLKVGDHVTVTGSPLKDGRPFMSVKKLVGPEGKMLSEGAE